MISLWIVMSLLDFCQQGRKVKCHYKAAQYCNILYKQLTELRQNINQMLDPQNTPHTSPKRASYGVSFANNCDKIDCVITASHCITHHWSMVWHSSMMTTWILETNSSASRSLWPKLVLNKASGWAMTNSNLPLIMSSKEAVASHSWKITYYIMVLFVCMPMMVHRALGGPEVWAPGIWKSNGALVKFCLRAQRTPQIGELVLYFNGGSRDP